MTYVLKFAFDAGSGVCLWAGSPEAKERFGYAIDHWRISLSENARRWLTYLIAWYDTSIDWNDPSTIERWSQEEWSRFREAAKKGLEMLRHELPGPHYEIKDVSAA